MREPHFLLILAVIASVVGSGTVFFRLVEGWSWVDAYFFVVATLSTVGYGDPVPVTTLGKIGTTVYIITGIGFFAWALNAIFGKIQTRQERLRARFHPHSDPDQEGDG